MANAQSGGLNDDPDAQHTRVAPLADSTIVELAERSIDEWEAADTAQRLIELDDEARAHMTPEEYSESTARIVAFLSQHEARNFAQCRALQNRNDSDVNQESTNMRTRPLDSQFGSDGNQYNPYAPHTSEEYMLQEIEAGRMDPEMMGTPRHPLDPADSPFSGNRPGSSLSQVHADGHVSWMAPGHRLRSRQGLNGPGVPVVLSDPHGASWFQPFHNGGMADEDMDEEVYPDVYRAMLPYLDFSESSAGSHSPYGTSPDPVFTNQESPFGFQGPLTSSPDPPRLNDILASGDPRQPYPASTGRERKRLAKPSLVVKLKTDSAQISSQAPVSHSRGKSDASSSSESSSAVQTAQNLRPFNLKSQGSVGMSSTNARTRAGWDPQPVRRLTRGAEDIQSPHRKRRRDAVSPQELSTEDTTPPTTGLPQGKLRYIWAWRIPANTFQFRQVIVDGRVLEPLNCSNNRFCVLEFLNSCVWRRRLVERRRTWRR